MDYTEDMKKDELVAAAELYLKAGVKWDHPLDADQKGPIALTKADLVVWLAAMKERLGSPVEITEKWIEENPELGAKYKVGDILLNPEAGIAPAPKPAEKGAPTPPQGTPVTSAKVAHDGAPLYFHGVKIRTIRNEVVSGRVYKHLELENGVSYTIPLAEFDENVKSHA